MIVVKSFCVLVSMELTEIMFIAIGCMLSIVAFFLKRESQKVERLNEKLILSIRIVIEIKESTVAYGYFLCK